MKSVAFAAVLLASTAAHAEITAHVAAAHPDATLRGAPMSGPYTTAFDDKCAEVRGLALHGEATCKRVRALRVGGLRAELHRVGWADGSGDYYLALHAKDGWYVSDIPLQIETEDGHAGHFDVGTIDAIELAQVATPAGHALSLQIRETWATYCNACETEKARTTPERSYRTSATFVCGVGAGGAPSCTAPLYTIGDADHPPRIVGDKLIARGVMVGEPTEYGQEWHDLADDTYTIAL
jgi:hypothetical protein